MWDKIIIIIATLLPTCMYIGFLPFNNNIYYLMLALLSMYAIVKSTNINLTILFLLMACAISIIIGNPPSFFKSWQRLGLFTLLLLAIFPVFESRTLHHCRLCILKNSLLICSFVGVISFFCYLLGINYMSKYYNLSEISINTAGRFSGITTHSMMLGPISACGLVFLFFKATSNSTNSKYKKLLYICGFMSFCSVLVSASRISVASALVGILTVLYLRYRIKISKFISAVMFSVIILVALYPVYEQFATPLMTKQEDNVNRGSMFDSRKDRWEHRIIEFKNSPITGIGFASVSPQYTEEFIERIGTVEPGSSWLSLLSMIGILGAVPIIYFMIATIKGLNRLAYKKEESIMLMGIILTFAIHLVAEGYILAGGSYLCFLFWLTLGVGYSYTRQE